MTTQTPDPEQLDTEQPSSPPKARIPRLGWKSPEDTTPSSSLDATTDAGAGASPGYPQMSAPELGRPSTKSGSSPESSPAKRAPFVRGAKVFFDSATRLLHRFLARDEYDRFVRLYRADKEDLEAIAQPASRLAYRHAGEIGQASNPDIADGAELGFAFIGYLMKQLDLQLDARELRRLGLPLDGQSPRDLTTTEPQP